MGLAVTSTVARAPALEALDRVAADGDEVVVGEATVAGPQFLEIAMQVCGARRGSGWMSTLMGKAWPRA